MNYETKRGAQSAGAEAGDSQPKSNVSSYQHDVYLTRSRTNTNEDLVNPLMPRTELSRHVSNNTEQATQYRTYKIRYFGLFQLTLLNIVISWDWLTFAPVSVTAGQYFRKSQSDINWLSTCIFFAFFAASPATMWVLNRGGPRPAILIASVLTFVGNWIRYAGTKAREDEGGVFGLVMFGQLLIGFAQPFVLSSPTRFSDLWFTETGRITATALPSLANPFGGALGQLVGPFIATQASQVPNLVLYVAIIASVATLPAFFMPNAPPTPPSATSTLKKTPINLSTLRLLFTNLHFYLVSVTFIMFVGCFNAVSSLINQILYPFSYSETDAGIAGALLILVGLVTAAITSPILDRYKRLSLAFLAFVVIIMAAMYIALIFAPWTRTVVAPYIILSVLGAAAFSLLPFSLELMVDLTYPVSPEVSSSICWAFGNLTGAFMLLAMNALKAPGGTDGDSPGVKLPGNSPPGNMNIALVYQACWAVAVVPAPLYLNLRRRKQVLSTRRGGNESEFNRAQGSRAVAGSNVDNVAGHHTTITTSGRSGLVVSRNTSGDEEDDRNSSSALQGRHPV